MLFTKKAVPKNKHVRVERLSCIMEKLFLPYFFEILSKALTFVKLLSVTIPRTIKLISASCFTLSSILLASHCPLIETSGEA